MKDTLPGLLAGHAADHPGDVALREKEFGIWQETTWAGFLGRVRAFSLGLVELGVKKGDRIAVIGDNRPEWSIAELGAQSIGAPRSGSTRTRSRPNWRACSRPPRRG